MLGNFLSDRMRNQVTGLGKGLASGSGSRN